MSDGIQEELTRHERGEERHRKAAAFVRRFTGIEGVERLFAYETPFSGITLNATTTPEHALKAVSGFLRALGERTAKKEFDENSGMVKYIIESENLKPYEKLVILAGKPKYCEMEAYEAEVIVPARPARVEMRTKYRLVDPGCLEAMK